jgi:uncharacterized protein YjbJ (UPF0337 family)
LGSPFLIVAAWSAARRLPFQDASPRHARRVLPKQGDIMADSNKDLDTRGAENRAEGAAKDLKGKVKDAVGGATGDTSLQAEGKIDQAKGKIQEKFGKAQQAVDE